jgi:hypothetical protein
VEEPAGMVISVAVTKRLRLSIELEGDFDDVHR